MIIAYGHDLESGAEAILRDRRLPHDEKIKFITEAGARSLVERYICSRQFDEMKMILGIDSLFPTWR